MKERSSELPGKLTFSPSVNVRLVREDPSVGDAKKKQRTQEKESNAIWRIEV